MRLDLRLMPSLAGAVAVCLLLVMGPGQAHHGVQAQFDISQVVEKRGILSKIDWINPHIYMHFEVLEDGVVKHYAIESLGILGLRRVGLDSKSNFKVGEPFIFTINPSRDGSDTGLLVTLIFPDGRKFEVKTPDTAAP